MTAYEMRISDWSSDVCSSDLATLAGNYGIYNGFELCEAAAVPGKEEYLNSEKYEIRAWDWDRPGNIREDVALVNRLRRGNPALRDFKIGRASCRERVCQYVKNSVVDV